MDKDDDESETRFGLLSKTTFHPLLAYQSHLYGHGLNVEQDDPLSRILAQVSERIRLWKTQRQR